MTRLHRWVATRRTLAMTLVALALAVPTAAYPLGLAQLLQLPLEQLLRLQITALRGAVAPFGSERHER